MLSEISLRSRIDLVMRKKNLNPRKISNGDDTLSRKVYYQITQQKTITADVLLLIIDAIPDLRTEWLFRGEGEPFRTGESIEDKLAAIQDRLSALEGERKNDLSEDCPAAASA